MRLFQFVCGIGMVLFIGCRSGAAPLDESKSSTYVGTVKPLPQLNALTPAGTSVDEYAIALSKAAHINVLVDATYVSPELRTRPYLAPQVKPTLNSVMDDFARSCKLAQLRHELTTYLLWQGPEQEQIASLILDEGKLAPAPTPPNELQLVQDLSRDYGRLPTSPGDTRDRFAFWSGTLSQLSPAAQAQIAALVRYKLTRPDYKLELGLTNEFWKTARVRLGLGVPQGGQVEIKLIEARPSLYVIGQDEKGNRLPAFDLALGGFDVDVLDEPNFEEARKKIYNQPLLATDKGTAALPPIAPLDLKTAVSLLASPPAPALSWATLEARANLAAKITFEAQRVPLSEALQTASKQSGVALTLGENAPGTQNQAAFLTARVEAMPLASFMSALSRLYGVTWTQKSPQEYVLMASTLTPLQRIMLQVGRGYVYNRDTEWQLLEERESEVSALREQISDEVRDPALGARSGIPVTKLSVDLQRDLRQVYTQRMLANFDWGYFKVATYLTGDCIVRLRLFAIPADQIDPALKENSTLPLGTIVSVSTANGVENLANIRLPFLLPPQEGIPDVNKAQPEANPQQ